MTHGAIIKISIYLGVGYINIDSNISTHKIKKFMKLNKSLQLMRNHTYSGPQILFKIFKNTYKCSFHISYSFLSNFNFFIQVEKIVEIQ